MREEFGKLVSYTIDENIVSIAYEKNTAYSFIFHVDSLIFSTGKQGCETSEKRGISCRNPW